MRNLGTLLDLAMLLEAEVSVMAPSAFSQLRLVDQLHVFLANDDLVTVLLSFLCWIIYILCGAVWPFQRVYNTTARLLTHVGRRVSV